MSIRTYFENIADAIREKAESEETYTPEEMPQAILNIPTGNKQVLYMIDKDKAYTYALNILIPENVGSQVCGNEFTVNISVKMVGVRVYSRANTNAIIKLTDALGNVLYSKTVSVVANMWQDFEIEYQLLANVNYIIFVEGVREMFKYTNFNYSNISAVLQEHFTFVQGHYAGIPGSPAPVWFFSVIPIIEGV